MRISSRQTGRAHLLLVLVALAALGCRSTSAERNTPDVSPGNSHDTAADAVLDDDATPDQGGFAEVTDVDISGSAGAYQFSVTIESPDTGCGQYADWWEVFDDEGRLIYRRILAHSHVDEQPFTRSGGPVNIQPDDNVYVRAHMNTTGYGPNAARIAPEGALEILEIGKDFAADIEDEAPQPEGCAF